MSEVLPAPAGEAFDAVRAGAEIGRRLGLKTSRNEPLARFTTMRVGGPADLYVAAHNAFELRGLVRHARARAIPYTILGRGSDAVISDAGIRGLVIHIRAEAAEIVGERLVAEAGLPMARAATRTAEAGLSGLEFGLAIPGNVGGAVWANAGAHGSDVAAILETATVLLADGREVRQGPAELGLAYRDSRLRRAGEAGQAGHAAPAGHVAPGGSPAPAGQANPVAGTAPADVVLGATFRLVPQDPATIRARLDEIRRWRRAHQPLAVPSAGSFFRNPVDGPSAGALIDGCGLKARRIGGAVVSIQHANWILNDAGGSAVDVRRLGELVRAEVEARTGVRLAFEVVFLGDWSGWEAEP